MDFLCFLRVLGIAVAVVGIGAFLVSASVFLLVYSTWLYRRAQRWLRKDR